MLENILQGDKSLFVFLNGLGTENFDAFWLFITKQLHWTPFFIVVLYFVYKKVNNWRQFLIVLFLITLLIVVTDQFTNFIKDTFQRLRPCNDPQIKSIIRIVKDSDTYSFFSGHAANSMATTVFVYKILQKKYPYAFCIFLFPLIFAYSRIYLGLHFPSDILTGYLVGAIFGTIAYRIFSKVNKRILQYSTNG